MEKVTDTNDLDTCRSCNCIDTGNEGHYSKKLGHKVWLCPECTEKIRKEEADADKR